MENVEQQQEQKRFQLQIFSLDTSLEQPVIYSHAVSCPDAKSLQMLTDCVVRQLQLLTYKPLDI